MKILCIGDIVGQPGRDAVEHLLPAIKQEHGIDLVVANAENTAGGLGLTPRLANRLFEFGCNVLTMGDHVWDKQELMPYLTEKEHIVRPANLPEGVPGRGWVLYETSFGKIAIINLLGRVFMRYNVDCPFKKLEDIIHHLQGQAAVIIVDIHAEATSEKVALGHFVDGRASVLVGTHTHIQTADEKILPNGTAYITDLGMSGAQDSVIGQNKANIIKRFLTTLPSKFEVAHNDVWLNGVVVDVNEKTGKAKDIIRIHKPYKTSS